MEKFHCIGRFIIKYLGLVDVMSYVNYTNNNYDT